jgi:hypothetical protein
MSVSSNMPSGSHQAMRPAKYTPAQNVSAYATLKLGGNNPGQRLNAKSARNKNGSQRFHFSFTAEKNNSRRGGDKLFEGFMIRLVGAIQHQQFLIFLQQILFARFFGQRAGFFCRLLPF